MVTRLAEIIFLAFYRCQTLADLYSPEIQKLKAFGLRV